MTPSAKVRAMLQELAGQRRLARPPCRCGCGQPAATAKRPYASRACSLADQSRRQLEANAKRRGAKLAGKPRPKLRLKPAKPVARPPMIEAPLWQRLAVHGCTESEMSCAGLVAAEIAQAMALQRGRRIAA